MTDDAASETTNHGHHPNPNHDDDHDVPDQGRIVTAAILFEGALAPAALLLGWLLGRPPLIGFGWSFRDVVLGVLAALPMYAVFQLLIRWPIGPLERIKRFFDDELTPLLGSRTAFDYALIAAAAGVGEELLFRGVLQSAFIDWLGTWEGLAAASLLFGLLHPISPAYVVVAALLGAYLGAVQLWSGNLLVVMIAHAVYDYLALRALFHDRADRDGIE